MQRTILSTLMSLATVAALAGGPVTWQFTAGTVNDGSVAVQLKAVCSEGWHIYALTLPRDDGPIPTSIRISPAKTYEFIGPVQEPAPTEVDDPNFQMKLRYHSGTVEFSAPIKPATKEAFTVEGEVEYMACNDKTCLPPQTIKFSVPFAAVK